MPHPATREAKLLNTFVNHCLFEVSNEDGVNYGLVDINLNTESGVLTLGFHSCVSINPQHTPNGLPNLSKDSHFVQFNGQLVEPNPNCD